MWSDTIQAGRIAWGPTQTGAIAENDLWPWQTGESNPWHCPARGHNLRPNLNRGGAQLVASPDHRTHPAALPNQGDHPVAPLECRAQPATIQTWSSASSTPWPESVGSGLTQWDTTNNKPHLPTDATSWPIWYPNLRSLLKLFSCWNKSIKSGKGDH